MMMMSGNHKKMAELIVAGIPSSKSLASQNEKSFKDQVDAGNDSVDEGELAVSTALLSAFKSDDPRRLALALKDAFQVFSPDDSEESEE